MLKRNLVVIINSLLTNYFLNKDIHYKLYVCHYLFCLSLVTKKQQVFDFAIDILKETIKYSYLNKKRKINDFYKSIRYCTIISASLSIELDIDELLLDIPNKILFATESSIKDSPTEESDLTVLLTSTDDIALEVLFHIRRDRINKQNYLKYIDSLYHSYILENNKEYLFSIVILSSVFTNTVALYKVTNELKKFPLTQRRRQFINTVTKKQKSDLSVLSKDIYSVLSLIDSDKIVDLNLIYYSFINEKTRRNISK